MVMPNPVQSNQYDCRYVKYLYYLLEITGENSLHRMSLKMKVRCVFALRTSGNAVGVVRRGVGSQGSPISCHALVTMHANLNPHLDTSDVHFWVEMGQGGGTKAGS